MARNGGLLMQVRVLGQVDAIDATGSSLALGGPTQRRVLAALALRRNEVVSVPYLVDVVWAGDDVPERASHNIRTYVHRLRTALDDDGDRLETVGAGYRLRLDDDELDAARFERLAGTANRLADTGDAVAALDTIEEAERLWHGAALEEFRHEDWAVPEIARLDELHATLWTRRAETLLDAGHPADAVVVLERLVADAPLRERPRALLMRALYESGRQPEALRAFQEFRRSLIDEIGVEPSTDLVALDRAIASGALPTTGVVARAVGGYELHERIGEGAFAVVHRATQTSLGREVAVKIIRAELANQPEFIRRFEAEAQMIARIEHPSVVSLYDYWREPDRAYLVMQWMVGGSLETRLDEGPWSVDTTVELVDQIADALDAAHRQGVVHRDVKPANILFDDTGRAYLSDFGIALGADERARPEAAPSEGSPTFAAPEQLRREPVGPEADVHALAIVAFTLLVGRTPFADAPDERTLLRRQLQDPIPAVCAVRPDLPVAVDEVLAIATAKDPGDRYPTASGFASAFRAACVGTTTPTDRPVAIRPRANPYKGLQAFDETDAADFHGRERLVDELIGHLAQPDARMIAVVGPSGSGKSSVVRAGLVPALRADAVPSSSRWFSTTLVPGARPFEALETALLRVAVNPPAQLLDQLRDGDRGILRAVRRIVPADDGVVAIVIDQFEELFTGGIAESERSHFLRALTVAATEPASPVRLLLTLRADFYDRPLRHPQFAPLLKQHTVVVTPLAPDELERAVVTPAATVGVGFEPGLVAEIISDVNHEPGALPLLQYALTQVFDATDGDTITIEAYRAIGGLTGALGQRAEDLYASAAPDEQRTASRLFGRLVALGEGTEDTRRRIRRTELGHDEATDGVLDRFGRARLLTFDHDPASREPTVEIAHEALIREWPRLRGWLDDDRDGLRIHRHLTETSAAWAEAGRDAGELYRGARLEAATRWAGSHDPDLNSVEREFLGASIAAHDAEVAAEHDRVTRLRRWVTVAASIAAIALVAGTIALWQWNVAGDRTDEARANEREAAANADQADRNAAEAAVNAEQAEVNARLAQDNADEAAASAALAQQRADEAIDAQRQADIERMRAVALANAAEDPTVSALLAVEAHRLDPSFDSLDALHRVLTETPGFFGTMGGGSYIDGVLIDDRTIAVATESAIELWDVPEQRLIRSIDHATTTGTTVLAPAGEGRVAALDADRTSTTVYDIASGDSVATLRHGSGVNDVAVSPDGDSLAAALAEGVVQIWSIADQALTASIDADPAGVAFLAWHPDGARLVDATSSGRLQLWDAATQELQWVTEPPVDAGIVNQLRPYVLSISPDGNRVAALLGSVNGQMHTIDVATGQPAFPPFAAQIAGFATNDVVWTDGDTILAAGRNATESVDLATGVATTVLDGYGQTGLAVTYLPALDRFAVAGPKRIELWASDGSGPLRRVLPYPTEHVDEFVAGRGGVVLTSLLADGTTLLESIVDLSNPQQVYAFDLTTDPATRSVAEGIDGAVVIGYGDFTLEILADFTVRMLDPELRPLGAAVQIPFDFADIGASPDGRFFAFGRQQGKTDLYRSTGEFVATLSLGDDEFANAQVGPSFSDDGEFVALNTTDGRSGLWRTSTAERVQAPDWMADTSAPMIGHWIFTAPGDGTAQRYDPETFEPVGVPVLLNGFSQLAYASFDETHLRVAAGGGGPTGAKVYDLATGRQLGRDLPYAGGSVRIEFSADGSILTVPDFDAIGVWNFDTDSWPDVACRFAGRNLTADEWAQLGPRTTEYRATCEQYPVS